MGKKRKAESSAEKSEEEEFDSGDDASTESDEGLAKKKTAEPLQIGARVRDALKRSRTHNCHTEEGDFMVFKAASRPENVSLDLFTSLEETD